MTISLPRKKVIGLKQMVNQLLCKDQPTAWDIAHLLGLMIVTEPAILPAIVLQGPGTSQDCCNERKGELRHTSHDDESSTKQPAVAVGRDGMQQWLESADPSVGRGD